jgi:hypothetical protein
MISQTFPIFGACRSCFINRMLLTSVGRLSMTARTYATSRLLPQVAVVHRHLLDV